MQCLILSCVFVWVQSGYIMHVYVNYNTIISLVKYLWSPKAYLQFITLSYILAEFYSLSLSIYVHFGSRYTKVSIIQKSLICYILLHTFLKLIQLQSVSPFTLCFISNQLKCANIFVLVVILLPYFILFFRLFYLLLAN